MNIKIDLGTGKLKLYNRHFFKKIEALFIEYVIIINQIEWNFYTLVLMISMKLNQKI